jgi:TetR/AcrR family transcriptional regulator
MPTPKIAKSPKRRPRGPGRPAENAADLRERLLDAALACFTAASMASTSLSTIAKRAGVTPALVNYYFGDKARLVDAVVQERLMPVVGELQAAVGSPAAEPSQLLRNFVQGVHAVVARHPWLPVIWVREILTEGGALRGLMLSQVAPMLPRMLSARLAQAQQAGALNPGLDPRLTVVSLIGLTLFPLAAESLWRQVFDADDIDASHLQNHTLALLERGLELRHA